MFHPTHKLMKMNREHGENFNMFICCCIDIIYDDDDDDHNSTQNSNCKMAEINVYYLWWIF